MKKFSAVEGIREALRIRKTEVVHADLAQYFDTIPHRKPEAADE